MSSERPAPATVMIGGSIRSGTTLLQRILCAAPGASANRLGAECHYLVALMRQHAKMTESFDLLVGDYFESPEAFATHMRARAETFLEIAANRYRPSGALVLKSPELTRHLPTLADWFSAMRFVVMLRDPRDTIASMLDVAERHRNAGQSDSPIWPGQDIKSLVSLYRIYYVPLARSRQRLQGRTLILRYEDLVRAPDVALPRLSAFTGLALTRAHLAPPIRREDERIVRIKQKSAFAQAFATPLLFDDLQISQIGRYRQQLSATDIQYIEQRCADIPKALSVERYW